MGVDDDVAGAGVGREGDALTALEALRLIRRLGRTGRRRDDGDTLEGSVLLARRKLAGTSGGGEKTEPEGGGGETGEELVHGRCPLSCLLPIRCGDRLAFDD